MKSPSRGLAIHESFLESVDSPQLRDIVVDATELTLDSIVDSEVLRKLPIVGTIVRTYGAIKTIRDRFFLKKLYRFFERIADMPQEERKEAMTKIRRDPAKARRIGEAFVVWLDRLDDEDKAELLAKVFELYLRGDIDFDRSSRFASVIERGHVPYLLRLRENLLNEDVRTHLTTLGLMRISASMRKLDRELDRDVPRERLSPLKFELNDDGWTFKEYVIDEMPVRPRIAVKIETPRRSSTPGKRT